MEQKYLDYALEVLEKIVKVPSPSGYAKEVSAFLVSELEGMGYEPKRTNKGGVGKGISCDEHQVSICVKDSNGPSDYELVSKLVAAAKAAKVDYAIDVYPFYGSDADAVLRAGFDVRHCVIGAGVAASHGYERSHRDGLVNTYHLVAAYVDEAN